MKKHLQTLSQICAICVICGPSSSHAADSELLHKDDFEKGAANWEPTDAKAWRVLRLDDGNHVFNLFGKSNHKPPHRSPLNIALLKEVKAGDFVLTARVRTTQTSRAHRDMCLFWGYQDPAHFYYVHLGEKTDDHANQIFIVNDADRIKISEKTSVGTPWKDDHWHHVKLVRKIESGLIELYFDDMETPAMIAHDKTFGAGRIGLGSFDDTGYWDDVEIRGVNQR